MSKATTYLILPVSKIERELRELLFDNILINNKLINTKAKVSKSAIIYLSAVIEYVITKIFEYAEPNLKAVQQHINEYEDLKELFKNFEYNDETSYSKLNYDYSKHMEQIYKNKLPQDLKDYTNEIIKYLICYIAVNANICKLITRQIIISARTIQSAVQLLFPNDLCIQAVFAGVRILTEWTSQHK
jgi:hypothetical protein